MSLSLCISQEGPYKVSEHTTVSIFVHWQFRIVIMLKLTLVVKYSTSFAPPLL